MALDKLIDSAQLDADLTAIADAIRTKCGTSARLSFPSGMAQSIADIQCGGGGGLHETGMIAIHAGVDNTTIHIPVSDSSLDHYLAKIIAQKSWLIEDGVWVEQNDITFLGTASNKYALISGIAANFQLLSPSAISSSGETINSRNLTFGVGFYKAANSSGNQSGNNSFREFTVWPYSLSINFDATYRFCNTDWGMTYAYEVWGWND